MLHYMKPRPGMSIKASFRLATKNPFADEVERLKADKLPVHIYEKQRVSAFHMLINLSSPSSIYLHG
jgi:hypothetical protein